MPKVGNKTFPYTAKGIDDAKKEKKRIASGGTVQKREPMLRNSGNTNGKTLERRPVDPNRVKPKPMPRMPMDPNRVRPSGKMPRFNAIPRPAKIKGNPIGAVPKPTKRRPVKTTPMKRKMK